MSTKEVDNSTGVYSKEMAAKKDRKAESIADFIPIVISYLMQFSCIDEVLKQAGGFKKVAAIVCEFILYLQLENCNCIHGLHLVVDMQMSCYKRVNKGHVWVLFLQELKALTSLQYGGDYRNCRDPKALVNYLESVRMFGLRGLNNYKYLCFMNHLLQNLPPTFILRYHFLSVEHNYKVLLLYRDKEMDSLWMHCSACWTGLTLWLDIHNSFSFLESNLEDKVLIEGGSIVMNGPEGVLVNGPMDRSLYLQQPKTSSSGYVWDPG